ncbi:MAG: ArsR family transcriptional regulator, arsenate/arsenite/antimonite-responsive transcriptional [Solirubrobacteraceae bacterium]|jgi:DNA-binding transcriptional ArsR family regulator|nr:ArsR family transcriptional regulator, arsenate/arsenite/antimonite-responsive transcriptional [Solirubrobacteraceae bacterium]
MSSERALAFEALADPTRRSILRVLADRGECPVAEITAEITHVGRTSVSSHLRVLRSARLVNERREGRYRMYSVDPDSVHEVVKFLTALYHVPLTELKDKMERAKPSSGEDQGRGSAHAAQ